MKTYNFLFCTLLLVGCGHRIAPTAAPHATETAAPADAGHPTAPLPAARRRAADGGDSPATPRQNCSRSTENRILLKKLFANRKGFLTFVSETRANTDNLKPQNRKST